MSPSKHAPRLHLPLFAEPSCLKWRAEISLSQSQALLRYRREAPRKAITISSKVQPARPFRSIAHLLGEDNVAKAQRTQATGCENLRCPGATAEGLNGHQVCKTCSMSVYSRRWWGAAVGGEGRGMYTLGLLFLVVLATDASLTNAPFRCIADAFPTTHMNTWGQGYTDVRWHGISKSG